MDEFDDVVRQVIEKGGALPSLTRAELQALGDRPALLDTRDATWWAGLSAEMRREVIDAARQGLIARNLVVAGEDRVLRPTTQVAALLRARHGPYWLLVLGEPGPERGSGAQIALNGIDLPRLEASAALICARIEGIYAHRFAASPDALDEAVAWLLRPLHAERASAGRTVEVLLPARVTGSPGNRVRGSVFCDAEGWQLATAEGEADPGDPKPIDAASLRAFLLDSITGLARAS